MTSWRDEPRTHWVYELWAGDQCLYVGVTANVPRRLREHSRKPWGHLITETRTTEFPTGRDALHLEARLIARHRPPNNRLGNPDFYVGLPFADSA